MNRQEENCGNCSPACFKKEIREGLGSRHALFIQSLGICSAIALTGYIQTSLVIGVIIILVAILSSVAVSMIRKLLMTRIRLMVQVSIITCLVTGMHLVLKMYWPEMRDALGPYLGLVITNCMILDSTERIGRGNSVRDTVARAGGRALGYAALLLAVALVREPLGQGSFAGIPVLPANMKPLVIMAAAPGAFFVMGLIWWLLKARLMTRETKLNQHE